MKEKFLKRKLEKRIAAWVLGIATALATVNLPVFTTTARAATLLEPNAPTINVFGDKEKLVNKRHYSLWKDDGGIVQKINFGKNNTWYIAGQDADGSLVLLCDPENPISTRVFLPADNYHDYNMSPYDYDINVTPYEGKDVYANHYGASDLRKYLEGEALNIFTSEEKGMIKDTQIYIQDQKNSTLDSPCIYSITSKLYLPYANAVSDRYITVGANEESDLSKGINVGLADYAPKGSPYIGSKTPVNVDKTEDHYWLRTYHVSDRYTKNFVLIGNLKGYVSAKAVPVEAPVLPAFNLDVSDVLFASVAEVASSDAALTDAMTIRMNGEKIIKSKAKTYYDRIELTKGTADDEYIYIQYFNWIENRTAIDYKVISKKITGTEMLRSDTYGLKSFENCKIWIEKYDAASNFTYATMAEDIKTVIIDNMYYGISEGPNGLEAELAAPSTLTGKVVVKGEIEVDGQMIPVTRVKENLFRQNKNITEVDLSKTNIRNIGKLPFFGASNLKVIKLPNTLEREGNVLGNVTWMIDYINIPSSWDEIYDVMFQNRKVKQIEIPSSIKKIAKNAFLNCTGLESVIYSGTEKQWKALIDANCGEGRGNDILKNPDLTVRYTHVHSGGTATCAQKKVCEDCGEEYGEINSGNHDYIAQVNEEITDQLVSAADCTHPAVYKKYCKGCLKLSAETFEAGTALGHSFKGGAAQTKCDRCGFTRTATKDVENLAVITGVKEATISWSPVPGAAKYAVYMKTSAGTTLLNSNVTTNSYKATGLAGGEKIGFTVRPYIDNWGSYSPVVWAMVHTPETAVASKVVVTTDMNQATVSWSEVSGAEAYALYQKNADGSTTLVSNKITGTTYTVTGLADGARVGYCVRAKLGSTWYGYSTVTWVTLPAPAVPPTGVKAQGGDGCATVTWNEVPGAGRYALYKKSQSGAVTLISAEVTGTSYEVTGLTNGETVGFVLKSRTSKGWSTWSATGWTKPQSGR